jgi:hypothetical protein
MTTITKPMRGRRPTKRLDLSDIKEALRDQRVWAALAVVTEPDDGSPHWTIVGGNADVLVEVVTTDGVPLSCRLAAGMWLVPDPGDEVAVLVPDGEVDWMPVITCILSHALPTDQGPQPNRIVIVRGEVLVHDGTGGAVPLALKSDVEAVDAKLDAHFHQLDSVSIGDPTSGPVSSIPPNPAAPPTYLPGTGVPLDPAEIVGTSVLKAK